MLGERSLVHVRLLLDTHTCCSTQYVYLTSTHRCKICQPYAYWTCATMLHCIPASSLHVVQISNGLTAKSDGKDKLLATVQVRSSGFVRMSFCSKKPLSYSCSPAVRAHVPFWWKPRNSQGHASQGRRGEEGFPCDEGAVPDTMPLLLHHL